MDISRESFIFIRHGRTDWSRDDITKGPQDLALNLDGQDDAIRASTILASREESYTLISSSLVRAKETARIISERILSDVTVFPDLHERYFGDYRLLTTDWRESSLPPDAEAEDAFKSRVLAAITATLNAPFPPEKRKVIVSHGLVFKEISFRLTEKQESIGYGEVVLFTPSDTEKTWTLQKLI